MVLGGSPSERTVCVRRDRSDTLSSDREVPFSADGNTLNVEERKDQ